MGKKIILSILLILGLILIGGGVWLKHNSTKNNSPESTQTLIIIPQGDSVIYERALYTMGGQNYELYIYDNGGILYIQEKGLRFPTKEQPATRTWNTGNLTAEQLNNLLVYLENSDIDELNDSYMFPGKPTGNGGFTQSDLLLTIIIKSSNLSKKVMANGYLSPDNRETYPDMPSPLNEIYVKLRALAMNTQQMFQENIE